MKFDIDVFITQLKESLQLLDLQKAAGLCADLVAVSNLTEETIPVVKAEKILQLLRNKRMFLQMQQVGDALIQTNRSSFKIRRQYAQALIDLRNYTAAVCILQSIISDIGSGPMQDPVGAAEYAEAKGLIGRVYKQLYVNAGNPNSALCRHYLTVSAKAYYEVYTGDRSKVWHGINTVALVERAKRDGVSTSNLPDAKALAERILEFIRHRNEEALADAWDYATAAEACIALQLPEEALRWMSGYARMPDCDAFELASTLRQLEEVWQLDLSSEVGRLLIPILRAELLKRSDSTLTLTALEVRQQKEVEEVLSEKYQQLEEATSAGNGQVIKLEKAFSNDSFKTYKWYMTGADRCLSVARLGLQSDTGFGTGFLLKGEDLKEDWRGDWVLLTNAHVTSNLPSEQSKREEERSLLPEDVVVYFEVLNPQEEFRNLEQLWSSPREVLDATILRFNAADKGRLQELTKLVVGYRINKNLPVVENPPTQKIYIIGHPKGGVLQLSFQDNLLLDHEKPGPRIHYRTPTEGGSSGSPVFNQQWDLIGLHHAGSEKMPRLNGMEGTYEANEGIWIEAIKKALSEG